MKSIVKSVMIQSVMIIIQSAMVKNERDPFKSVLVFTTTTREEGKPETRRYSLVPSDKKDSDILGFQNAVIFGGYKTILENLSKLGYKTILSKKVSQYIYFSDGSERAITKTYNY